MPSAVMHEMASLTEAAEIAQPVVAGIVVEMRGSEHNAGGILARHLLEVGPARRPATTVAPSATPRVEPAPVRKATNGEPMRPAAALTGARGALEPHPPAQL